MGNGRYGLWPARLSLLFACLALSMAWMTSVSAHQLRMAYLQLHETDAETYQVLWKVPARGERARLALSVELPGQCETLSAPAGDILGGVFSERWRIRCTPGLSGGRIRVQGLGAVSADALVRIEYRDASHQVARLTPAAPEFTVAAAPGALQTATTYLSLGIEHILLGVDHLLFVLALLLIVTGTRRLVATVTAFTVAHSVTLVAATLGILRVPIAPVEAVIALSIVFVASEILRVQRGQSTLTARAPWLVAFAFGLLHGFGFASALGEIGLPQTRIPLALLFFNLGVETGQLIFIAAVVTARSAVRAAAVTLPRWLVRVPPYAIGTAAMFWVIQRVAAFQ